jgi:hypothetical protein
VWKGVQSSVVATKTCEGNGESTGSHEEAEIELMDVNDSDASESMDVDGRIIPVDCVCALISREKC